MNTRKDNNGRAMKAWKNTPPGHIAKPLRHIRKRIGTEHPTYLIAQAAAKSGDGLSVQSIARFVR